MLGLGLLTGFGLRDVRALGRYWAHRQGPSARLWSAPEGQGELVDFALATDGSVLAIREGALGRFEGGELKTTGPAQGVLRLFQDGSEIRAAGTYHRVLAWDAKVGLYHLVSVRGTVRDVQGGPERFAVAFEGEGLAAGPVQFFRRFAGALLEPEGPEIPIGMDRWSGFDLSPDGRRILANLPGGKGVGIWASEDGRLLASWPTERLARVLCFLDDDRVLFDEGPVLRGQDAAYGSAGNRLRLARVGAGGAPETVVEGFATVLAATRWPDRSRLAFADMEGLVRVVELGARPRLTTTFAPRGRGLPWRLRPAGRGLWVLLKGGDVRIERYEVE